jgi:hypothetical protein
LLSLLNSACEPADPNLVSPDGEDGATGTRVVIVDAQVREEDRALAEQLGWEEGVPATEVRYRLHGTGEWRAGETDSSGQLVLEGVGPGLWHVYGGRRLSASETEALDGSLRGLGDGLMADIEPGSGADTTRLTLELFADRSGSLVISEFASGIPNFTEFEGVGTNEQGRYMEVYNNSDRTLYLDGKLLLNGEFLGFHPTAGSTCADSEGPRTDPSGLITRLGIRFPGSGADHPIAPGEAVVIAAAAIDHTDIHPDMPDLSDADFELPARTSVDNPDVPDMESVGFGSFGPEDFRALDLVWFLADPVDLSSLPIVHRDHTGRGYVKVPAEKILDAVANWYWWPEIERGPYSIPCQPVIHPNFDRHFTHRPNDDVVGADGQAAGSLQRRILRFDGGRRVLLNTNTGATDFAFFDRSPGFVPEALIEGIGMGLTP